MAPMQEKIICFGEVLWDMLPTGKMAGGAPMNVAYHLKNFGLSSAMISRIGRDDLGKELLAFLHQKGVSTELIQKDDELATGTVMVELDESGSAQYKILQPVAWDNIQPGERTKAQVQKAKALVFGSLSCRSEVTKDTLLNLLDLAQLKVFDVNLRPPFYSKALLEKMLSQTDVVKMNDEELDLIAKWYGLADAEKAQLIFLKEKFALKTMVITQGKDGAICLDDTGFYKQTGFPVKVRDTIGSGDSFLAAFLRKYLRDHPIQECLEFACATGAVVASKKGGTPEISMEIVAEFIKRKN